MHRHRGALTIIGKAIGRALNPIRAKNLSIVCSAAKKIARIERPFARTSFSEDVIFIRFLCDRQDHGSQIGNSPSEIALGR
jgi:hypothetical protein